MSLKPLAQHEAERAANRFGRTPGYATGIACPECGAELFAFIGGIDMLANHNGRHPVFCRKCCHETTAAPGFATAPAGRPTLRPGVVRKEFGSREHRWGLTPAWKVAVWAGLLAAYGLALACLAVYYR
jgi:hypothetical protein